jgi:hypothetical protein
MMRTRATAMLTEAKRAISALCGGACGYNSGLGMSGRVNVLTAPIHVMTMLDELRFICARRSRISRKYCSRSDNCETKKGSCYDLFHAVDTQLTAG